MEKCSIELRNDINAGRARRVMLNVIAVLAFLIFIAIFATRLTFAGTVNLEPGKSYDISKYGNNTELKITKDGSYTFSGSSSTVFISVNANDARLYLDNVKIQPGATANTGKKVSAIDIAEKSGSTVSIISKSKSDNTLVGYMHPAVNKPGTKTKLIFDTENPSKPGYISAVAKTNESPAIGRQGNESPMYGQETCGNIYIKGGEIEAENFGKGAAVGGGYMQNLKGFYMSGGKLTATAHKSGAGIGGGGLASCDDIKISGGTIVAYGAIEGAGIGCGESGDQENESVGTITITGGNVYAKGGRYGAGIGGGGWCGVRKIKISGGNIEAYGGKNASGIGSGGGASWNRATSIYITGGNILAVGNNEGAGIGADPSYDRDLSINISGGTVVAKGGSLGDGIGGGGHIYTGLYVGSRGNVKIAISGGTITSYAGNKRAAIGPGDESSDKFSITITGGNIKCTSEYSSYNDFHGATPKDAEGNAVKLREFKFLGAPGYDEGDKVDRADKITDIATNYGLKDVKTMENRMYTIKDGVSLPYSILYAYLSDSRASVSSFKLERAGKTLPYNIKMDGYYTCRSEITLDKNGVSGENGSAYVVYGKNEGSFSNVVSAKSEGLYAIAYYDYPVGEGTKVLMADKGFVEWAANDVASRTAKYIEKSLWVNNDPNLSLYASWQKIKYSIHYEANAPKGCTATGEMFDYKDIEYGAVVGLTENQYKIKGYDFAGWNTKADGSGTAYSDEAKVSKLGSMPGEVVKLYAQWTPKTYIVKLESDNSGQLSSYSQELKYNESAQLELYEKTGFTAPSGKMFVGWDKKGAVDSRSYPDGATVKNLCAFIAGSEDPQGFTLTARYMDEADIKVYASYSGEPITDFTLAIVGSGDLAAIKKDLTAEEDINHNRTGYYTCTNTGTTGDIPQGTYDLCIRDGSSYKDTGIDVVADENPNFYRLDYYRLDLSRETPAHFTDSSTAHYTVKAGSPEGAKYTKESVEYLLKGTELAVTAGELKQGYHFKKWESGKIDPSGTAWRTALSFDTVINADMELTAVSGANHYSISEYASNVPEGCSSSLEGLEPEGISGIGYGEKYALPECGWTLKGYKFTGWTAVEILAGGQEGKKTEKLEPGEHEDILALQAGSSVKLIANWEPINYTLDFNSALPLSEPVLAAEGRACTYDQTLEIPTLEEISWSITDYHFLGWNSRSDGSGKWYEEGAELKNLASEDGDHFVLWAVWEHDSYTVYFDANGGSGTMEPQDIWTNTDDNLNPCTYDRAGYVFKSWNTRADGSGASYADGAVVNNLYTEKDGAGLTSADGESVTLYAQWEKEKGKDKDKDKKSATDTGDHNEVKYLGLYVAICMLNLLMSAIIIKKRFSR